MSELQKRIEIQNILQQNVAAIMQQYDVSPMIMDDVLSKIMLQVKDLVIQETLLSLSSKEQNQNKEEITNGGEEFNNEN